MFISQKCKLCLFLRKFLSIKAYFWFQQENGWVEETPGMVGGRRSLTTPASHTNNLLGENRFRDFLFTI